MPKFICYDNSTGKITKLLEDNSESGENANSNVEAFETLLVVSEHPNPSNTYIVGNVLTSRPSFTSNNLWSSNVILADGVQEARFGNVLPSNTVVDITTTLAGVPSYYDLEVSSNVFTMTTTVPGEYLVTFKRFPYEDYSSNVRSI